MTSTPIVRDVLASAAQQLHSRIDAEWLLMHALGVDRAWLFAHALDPLDAAQLTHLQSLVERRAGGEPVAYIIGRQGFWRLDLVVTPATLIPRPETEVLVEQALARMPVGQPCAVADLGTGSGAIALALAHERPEASIRATDRSAAALAVARENARRLNLDRVSFAEGSWCEALDDVSYDLIVSNPPYIEAADSHLAEGDLRFEPQDALASGTDGLDAIREIVREAPAHLSPGGWLLLEHGWTQGEPVRELLQRSGYREVFTARDLEGRERVTGGIGGFIPAE